MQLLLGQHSRPVSVDGPAQAHSSRGPSGDVHHSSRASSAQLAPMQRSSSEATAALSATSRASDEHLNLHHSHPPGEGHNWQEHGGHALGDIPELAPSNYAPGRCALTSLLHALRVHVDPLCSRSCLSIRHRALPECTCYLADRQTLLQPV